MEKATHQFNVHRLRQQANELNVLNGELKSLNPSAKVYRQLGSGGVLFLASKANLERETQSELADVREKLKRVKGEQLE